MNQQKFEKRIYKKYGVSSDNLKDLSIGKIKNLKNINSKALQEKDKFKIIKKPIKGIVKGATIGMGVAGSINSIFPNLVPVASTYLLTSSNIPEGIKLSLLPAIASLPVDLGSGYVVLGIGALTGVILNTGYQLIKNTTNTLKIVTDRSKAKRINKNIIS